jgi:uncharacterized protein YndB with AHSA1/START domain
MTKQASELEARAEISVNVPIETAYQVFTDGIDTWWPRTHHLGNGKLDKEIVEPRVGGRCYGLEADGTECLWGTVLVWDPPGHFALAWQINLAWEYEPDLDRASRVDVTFATEGPDRTTVTVVHSAFDRQGAGWESMRDSVRSEEGGWPWLLRMFGAAAEAA